MINWEEAKNWAGALAIWAMLVGAAYLLFVS